MFTFEWMLKGPVVILLLPHPGKSFTGEGSGRFKKLENLFGNQREDSFTSLEVCYNLLTNVKVLPYS